MTAFFDTKAFGSCPIGEVIKTAVNLVGKTDVRMRDVAIRKHTYKPCTDNSNQLNVSTLLLPVTLSSKLWAPGAEINKHTVSSWVVSRKEVITAVFWERPLHTNGKNSIHSLGFYKKLDRKSSCVSRQLLNSEISVSTCYWPPLTHRYPQSDQHIHEKNTSAFISLTVRVNLLDTIRVLPRKFVCIRVSICNLRNFTSIHSTWSNCQLTLSYKNWWNQIHRNQSSL